MERRETAVGTLSDAERETRRKAIVARLSEISKTEPGGSSEHEIRFQEAVSLERELREIDPPGAHPEEGLPPLVESERRGSPENRAAIQRLLDETRQDSK